MTDIQPYEQEHASSACLVLLCKRPALGHSKQRLAVQVGQAQALQFARMLLDCALEDLNHWPGPKAISPDQPQFLGWGSTLCPDALCLPQQGGNLGQRLNDLDSQLRARGQRRLIFIGSDCPTLAMHHYHEVDSLLAEYDTVLLKAQDGGVALMASNRPWPELSRLPWSTERLGQALADSCSHAGHSVVLAGELFDIDHLEDLTRLAGSLVEDLRPTRQHLRDALQNLGAHAHA